MKRIPTPQWITDLVTLIATDHGLPVPEIEFKQAPESKIVYGFRKRRDEFGLTVRHKITYLKEYGANWYHGNAHYPNAKHPAGRIVLRVRDLNLPLLPSIVLHEMAHLVAGEGTNHSVEFYYHLYQLADKYGDYFATDPTEVALWEGAYKPRNSVDGYVAWRASAPLTERAA